MATKVYVPIDLPSKCKCYPGVSPEDIKIRTLTGREEELMAELSPVNAPKNIMTVIGNVIEGIDVKRLTSKDILHILLWEAISSFDRLLTIRAVCGMCKQKTEANIDLSQVSSEVISDDYVYPYKVMIGEKEYAMRPQTLGDEVLQVEYSLTDKPIHILGLAQRILTDDPLEQTIKVLEEMDVRDLALLRNESKYSLHGPDMMGKYICPNCQNEERVFLPFRLKELFRLG